jgi:hypothetical protein
MELILAQIRYVEQQINYVVCILINAVNTKDKEAIVGG